MIYNGLLDPFPRDPANAPVLGFSLGVRLLAAVVFGLVPRSRRRASQLLARLQALPDVAAATTSSTARGLGGYDSDIEIAGRTHTERWNAFTTFCDHAYFDVVGVRLRRGRLLSEAEVNSSRRVIVVNEEFERADSDAAGSRRFDQRGASRNLGAELRSGGDRSEQPRLLPASPRCASACCSRAC